jgi:replicative DNA helicase
MNRSVEQRRGDYARPQLSDLRESGALEQDADIVMFIHREYFSDPESPEAIENRGRAEIIIAKHRNGPLGSFKLAYRPEMFRFDNLETFETSEVF